MQTLYEVNLARTFVWKVTALREFTADYVSTLMGVYHATGRMEHVMPKPSRLCPTFAVTVEFNVDGQPTYVLWLSAESYAQLRRFWPEVENFAEPLRALEVAESP